MRARYCYGLGIAAWSAALAAPALAASPASPTLVVTRNDSMVQIVAHADPVVKSVMALLLVASIATWALWIIKTRELRAAKACLKKDIAMISGASSLEGARAASYRATVEMVDVAIAELQRAGGAPTHRQLEGVEDRVAVQLPMVEARAMHRIQWGSNILASVGSISPFVGLAGTVWGIMNSFMGIARSNSTSLAVVAPGIAEALLATAIGLVAAIPAVLIYNGIARSIAGYRRLLNEVAVLAACLLSRESERVESRDTNFRSGPAAVRTDAPVVIARTNEGR